MTQEEGSVTEGGRVVREGTDPGDGVGMSMCDDSVFEDLHHYPYFSKVFPKVRFGN